MSTLLPTPEEPMMKNTSPSRTSKLTPSSTTLSPKDFLTLTNEITDSLAHRTPMRDSRVARKNRSGRGDPSYRKAAFVARLAIVLTGVWVWLGCGSSAKPAAVPPHDARAALCKVDQTREFY